MQFLATLLLALFSALAAASPEHIVVEGHAVACTTDGVTGSRREIHAQPPGHSRESILVPAIVGLPAPVPIRAAPQQEAGASGSFARTTLRLLLHCGGATRSRADALSYGVAARGGLRPYYPTAPPLQG